MYNSTNFISFMNDVYIPAFSDHSLPLRKTKANLEEAILDLLVAPTIGTSPSFLVAKRKRESALFQTILFIDHMTTPQQREHVTYRLDS